MNKLFGQLGFIFLRPRISSPQRARLCSSRLATPSRTETMLARLRKGRSKDKPLADQMSRAFLIVALYCLPLSGLAYEPTTTHAGLTQEIVDFYNNTHSTQISSINKELIIQGSIDEDIPAVRAINHFYDPVRNIGINNGRTSKEWAMGNIP